MLIIRNLQMEVFEQESVRQLVPKAKALMRELWPLKCAGLTDVALESRVRAGIAEAREFDITTERQICRYLNILFALDEEFPNPSAHPWAIEILNDIELSPEQRIDRLWDKIKERMLPA